MQGILLNFPHTVISNEQNNEKTFISNYLCGYDNCL